MKGKKITAKKFEAQVPKAEKKDVLRTAAYCRVSTLMEEQELSYESQCEYYEKVISADPGKILVGVYGDHGESGLHMENREELQKMLTDCREGKIDLIMTKSISRFARNAAECQRTLDELRELGIPVIFEKENLRSDDPQLTLVLKLLIAAAQEESNSISQAIKWSYDNNVKNGQPTRVCAYGYRKRERLQRTDPHIWEIYEPEAENVRIMFNMIIDGFSISDVAVALTDCERKKGSNYTWKTERIKNMLTNEVYKGDILSNKTYRPDMLSTTGKVNNGEREQFYLHNHHDPIVSEDTFAEVQIILSCKRSGKRKETTWKK